MPEALRIAGGEEVLTISGIFWSGAQEWLIIE
jgi:hypothetical protein